MATAPLDSFQAGMYTLRARTGLKMPRWNEFEVPKQQPRTRRGTSAAISADNNKDASLDSTVGLTPGDYNASQTPTDQPTVDVTINIQAIPPDHPINPSNGIPFTDNTVITDINQIQESNKSLGVSSGVTNAGGGHFDPVKVSLQHQTTIDPHPQDNLHLVNESVSEKGVYNSMEIDRIEDAIVLIDPINITKTFGTSGTRGSSEDKSRAPQSRGTRNPEPNNRQFTANLEMTIKTRSMTVKGDAAGKSQDEDVVVRRASSRTPQDLAPKTNSGRTTQSVKAKDPTLKSNKIGKSPLRGAVKRKLATTKTDNAKAARLSARPSKTSSRQTRSSDEPAKAPGGRRQTRNTQSIKDHAEVPYQTRSASKRKSVHFEEAASAVDGNLSSKRVRSGVLKAVASNDLDISDTESELSEAPSNVSSTVDFSDDDNSATRKNSFKSAHGRADVSHNTNFEGTGRMKSLFISALTQDGQPWAPQEEEFQLPEYIIEKYKTHKEATITNEGVAEHNATHL